MSRAFKPIANNDEIVKQVGRDERGTYKWIKVHCDLSSMSKADDFHFEYDGAYQKPYSNNKKIVELVLKATSKT